MSMNVCIMAGKQAGIIGILTTLAKKLHILAVVSYDENVTIISKEFQIPVFTTVRDAKFINTLNKSDLLVSIHGREIVPKELLSLPRFGCINVHPCLYKYKGKDPIRLLIENKDSKASVGVHYMTEEIDTGKVLIEEFIDVEGLESIESVYNALYPVYSLVLSKAFDIIKKTSRNYNR